MEKKDIHFKQFIVLGRWFKTRCEIAGMKPINVEKLLSHSIGISNSYYRPTDTGTIGRLSKSLRFIDDR